MPDLTMAEMEAIQKGGKPPPKPVAKPKSEPAGLTMEQMQAMQGAVAKPKGIPLAQRWQDAKTDATSAIVKMAKEYNTANQEGFHHPVDYSWGMAKGMLSGLLSLGGEAVEGVSGLAQEAIGKVEKNASKNFASGEKAGKKLMDHFAPAIQQHLKETGDHQQAAQNALAIIPQAITAAGDTGFDLTQSPFVGATVQAVGTLASLLGLKGAVKAPIDLLRGKQADIQATLDKSRPVPKQLEVQTEASGEFGTPKTEVIENPAATKEGGVPLIDPLEPTAAEELASEFSDEELSPEDEAPATKEAREYTPPKETNVKGIKSFLEARLKAIEVEHSSLQNRIMDLIHRRHELGLSPEQANLRKIALIQKQKALEQQAGPLREKLNKLPIEPPPKPAAITKPGDKSIEELTAGLWNLVRDQKIEAAKPEDTNAPPKVSNSSTPPKGPKGNAASAAKSVPKENPVVFQQDGVLVRRSAVQHAFNIADRVAHLPGIRLITNKMEEYFHAIQNNIAPESRGAQAKAAAAILAKNMSQAQMKEANFFIKAKVRRAFWNSRIDDADSFIDTFEKGGTFADPALQQAADAYRGWNERVSSQDKVDGIEYEPVDNYLYHTFEESDRLKDFLGQRYRAKWGNPGFTKDRVFDLYEQARAAGFKPRFTNPEDIMLARQHASDIAHLKIQALRDLADAGLAVGIRKGSKGPPDGFADGEFRAPNGERYFVQRAAAQVLHNAWNTTSLWQKEGLTGDVFRSAMGLKNALIPVKLGFSLFHPIHVATIDNATGMVRASKELLTGQRTPQAWFKDMLKSTLYLDTIRQSRSGYRLMKLWRGELPEGELTDADRQSLQWMVEGGFVPEMPVQYRTGALQKFQDAVQRHSATAVWHAPFAVLDAMQKPVFQVWIPSLKAASFLQDAKSAIKADPTLLDHPLKRQVAFRKLAKSVDNRYGEMAYSTLFWNRWMKDVAVANTLSLGWQLGFMREYGGAASDLGEALTKSGSVAAKARAGLLDRPLFTLFYTTQALAYGGLLTYAMTGQHPQQLLDYVYPRVGTKPDGTADRVSTMFYPREFWAIYKHVHNEGLVSGIGDLLRSKSSGVIGTVGEALTGVNSFGEEIRDPNAPAYKQLEQSVANMMKEFEPISLEAIHRGGRPGLSAAGFTPAPKYITETPAQSLIQRLYDKYYQGKETPYERVQRSQDVRQLREAYNAGQDDKFNDILEKMRTKYKLSAPEEQRIMQELNEPPGAAYVRMFKRLSWRQQKQALDKMTPDERDTFLPISNVDHLRYTYQPPGE